MYNVSGVEMYQYIKALSRIKDNFIYKTNEILDEVFVNKIIDEDLFEYIIDITNKTFNKDEKLEIGRIELFDLLYYSKTYSEFSKKLEELSN